MRIASTVTYTILAVLLTTVAAMAQGTTTKADEWKSVKFCSMTFSVPKTLTDNKARGTDSCVAGLSDDAVSLSIDFGWYSGVSRNEHHIDFEEEAIVIDGKKGTFATYRDSRLAPEKSWVGRVFIVIEPRKKDSPELATNMFVVVRSKAQLFTAERIIRSIKFDTRHPDD